MCLTFERDYAILGFHPPLFRARLEREERQLHLLPLSLPPRSYVTVIYKVETNTLFILRFLPFLLPLVASHFSLSYKWSNDNFSYVSTLVAFLSAFLCLCTLCFYSSPIHQFIDTLWGILWVRNALSIFILTGRPSAKYTLKYFLRYFISCGSGWSILVRL